MRRAWLCGVDPLTKVDHEQRKLMVEARIRELGSIFAVGIYAYAVMSNHLHVVVSVEPDAAAEWNDEEVAERWLRLYPVRDEERYEARKATLLSSISIYRKRLSDLSWFMKCLDEYVARKANAEDKVTGRFWEGEAARLGGMPPAPTNASAPWRWPERFKCQLLTDEKALAAAMAYVDLNPVRAKIASNVETSDHTSVQVRANELRKSPEKANDTLRPIVGLSVFRLPMTEAQYIEPVDYTGRQVRPDKRGAIAESEPPALRRLALDPDHWTGQVKGIGSAYWRIVGTAEAIMAKAEAIGQEWMKGVGYARWLERFL